MEVANTIGLVAGILTSLAFMPQLLRVWRTKSSGDVSNTMLAVQCTGVLLWTGYGLMIGSFPVIGANSVTFVVAASIWLLKRKYDSVQSCT